MDVPSTTDRPVDGFRSPLYAETGHGSKDAVPFHASKAERMWLDRVGRAVNHPQAAVVVRGMNRGLRERGGPGTD